MFCNTENYTNNATNNSKPKMLQIGIKKRVENCTTKTKKGDLLYLHYNVRGVFGLNNSILYASAFK